MRSGFSRNNGISRRDCMEKCRKKGEIPKWDFLQPNPGGDPGFFKKKLKKANLAPKLVKLPLIGPPLKGYLTWKWGGQKSLCVHLSMVGRLDLSIHDNM